MICPDCGTEHPEPEPVGLCPDGADHLQHIWPVEPFKHDPSPECVCDPEFIEDEFGFFFLHHRVDPEGAEV